MKDFSKLIDRKNIPQHVAVIMDGNGRWATERGLSRGDGHRMGSESIEPLMDAAIKLGIKAVSLYAFSTENWTRPSSEIKGLWNLLEEFFSKKIDTIKSKGIRIRHSGLKDRLPPSTKKAIAKAENETAGNKTVILNFCINYGGRQEIVRSVNSWLEKTGGKKKISMNDISRGLYTSDMPELDLLIRTSGECRISNFLLWQAAYAEMVFMDVLWPDFRERHLVKAVYEYQKRERRYGGL